MFVSRVNAVTGKAEWTLREEDGAHTHVDDNVDGDEDADADEDTDMDTDDAVHASMHLDMLNDEERNEVYDQALRACMDRPRRVLDIGTGSGLLALLAARAGAATVTACEVFPTVAHAAQRVVRANGLEHRVKVIAKRSDALTVGGPDAALAERADLIVTEIFDTDLLGEGILPSLRHAFRDLVTPDATVIPKAATVYAQLVACPRVWQSHDLAATATARGTPLTTEYGIAPVARCTGAASTSCIQATTLADAFVALSAPWAALHIDFSGPHAATVAAVRTVVHSVPVVVSGEVHCVLFWWDLHLTDHVTLSTAPGWARSADGRTTSTAYRPTHTPPLLPAGPPSYGWRDHWMQALCFLPAPMASVAGETAAVTAAHDDYAVWFRVAAGPAGSAPAPTMEVAPACTCLHHVFYGRERILQLNDRARQAIYTAAITDVLAAAPVDGIVSADDGILLPVLAAAEAGRPAVDLPHLSGYAARLHAALFRQHAWGKTMRTGQASDDGVPAGGPYAVLLAEPFFANFQSSLPWRGVLHFWHLRTAWASVLAPGARVVPAAATIFARACHLPNLWRSHASVTSVLGIDVRPFNALCGGVDQSAPSVSTCYSYPVHMYEPAWRSAPTPVLVLALAEPLDATKVVADVTVPLPLTEPGPRANAVVFSVDLDLLGDGRHVVHDGVDSLAHRQGVAFFHLPAVATTTTAAASVRVRARLQDDGELSITLSL